MNARNWLNRTSFHHCDPAGPQCAGCFVLSETPKPEASWDTWDADRNAWRHWAKVDGKTVETDEIGIAL